ncbi:hypothetical protein Sme01_52530 [Sphaerisporangium melleum]|uniref:DUF2306 domain-containing protein n=1 Tax=Sphaerisporangium melleum TaxID=321316 RepID=A0A917R650_9ACTN|nr:DUF2306 domain-containing protein [Sphaerisporangium melleum]GGK91107.1 hypothetical protein GCM10007964_37210 [Sphaerisporangium melleum]GII72777.1 hypothetical protein Sme01_52530 [Sphaerisporangium melleum]
MTIDTDKAGVPTGLAEPPATTRVPAAPQARKPFWRRPWILPLAAVVATYLFYQISPYVPESTAPVPPHDGFPAYYPVLVTHMVASTLAIITAVFQVWPWLRKKHPAVHRASGRVYLLGAVVGGITGLIIVRFAPPVGQIGVSAAVSLWMIFTIVAVVYARKGRYDLHRRFMLYSFAIVMNNIWGVLIVNVLMRLPWEVNFVYMLEAARWTGWVFNLMLVQWWLYHTEGRDIGLPRGAKGKRVSA